MDVGVRSSNDIYDPIAQVGWLRWVSRKIVDEKWSPCSDHILPLSVCPTERDIPLR
jgi:hypothetical protein